LPNKITVLCSALIVAVAVVPGMTRSEPSGSDSSPVAAYTFLASLKAFLDSDHTVAAMDEDEILLGRALEAAIASASREDKLRMITTPYVPSVKDARTQGRADAERGEIHFQAEEAASLNQDIERRYQMFEAAANRLAQSRRDVCGGADTCLTNHVLVIQFEKRRAETWAEWRKARDTGQTVYTRLDTLEQARPAGSSQREQVLRHPPD